MTDSKIRAVLMTYLVRRARMMWMKSARLKTKCLRDAFNSAKDSLKHLRHLKELNLTRRSGE